MSASLTRTRLGVAPWIEHSNVRRPLQLTSWLSPQLAPAACVGCTGIDSELRGSRYRSSKAAWTVLALVEHLTYHEVESVKATTETQQAKSVKQIQAHALVNHALQPMPTRSQAEFHAKLRRPTALANFQAKCLLQTLATVTLLAKPRHSTLSPEEESCNR